MENIESDKKNRKWTFRESTVPFFKSKELSDKIIEVLSKRGISSEDEAERFLYPKFEDLSDPFDIPNMIKAVEIIEKSIKEGEKIAIYGDYDVDGISATALLVSFFNAIDVDALYYIPSRIDEGYGLNKPAIDNLIEKKVKLIITVDCGSTSFKEIEYAKKNGLKVVVTDHHTLKIEDKVPKLPIADAVINPKLAPETKPYYELAGVGVAFYLARALQTKFFEKFSQGQEKWLLDLVALGTVCDIVPLTKDNRILVKFGLLVLAKTKRVGLSELARLSGFDIKNVDTYKIGFQLGPRLNSSGRVEHANLSLELLMSQETAIASSLAERLDELNKLRQEMTEKIIDEAKDMIRGLDGNRKIFLLSNKNWPSGVLGIVASRLVEEYGKPVLLMEETGEDLKGSARSIKGFNILDALTKCSEYFVHFGGHSAAAGFSLKKEHFLVLDEKLIKISDKQITEEELKQEIILDANIEMSEINDKFMDELKLLEPYGRDNQKPIFCFSNVELLSCRLVGNRLNHLKVTVSKNNFSINGIAFNFGNRCEYKLNECLNIAASLEENEWANQKKTEIRIIDIKSV